jgi:hypothetical protein
MKEAFTRLLVYLFILVCLFGVFGGLTDAGSPLPNSTLAGKFAHYLGYYGVAFGFWIVVFEGVYRAIRWKLRRQKKAAESRDSKQSNNRGAADLYVVPITNTSLDKISLR